MTPTLQVAMLASTLLAAEPRVTATPEAATADSARFAAWYHALRDLGPDASRGMAVEGSCSSATWGASTWSGTLHLLDAIEGRTFGAVFSGEGRFEMTVPDPIERAQLVRELDTAEPAWDFRNAVFLFTDFTLVELGEAGAWSPLEPPRDAEREVDEVLEYVTDGDGWVDRTVMLPLMNEGPGFFYAHFSESRDEPLVFSVDPHYFEEVSLYGRTRRGKSRAVVTRFHRERDYTTGRSVPQEALDLISIASYDIENNLDIVARATATVTRRIGTYDWVPFRLYSELSLDSLRWDDGSPVAYYRPEKSPDLWVDVSSIPADTAGLTFHYSGDMMDRPQNLWVQIASHTTWYPVYEAGRPIPYTLTFHAPDEYVGTTLGTRTGLATNGDRVTATFETPPLRAITFNIGEFEAFESDPPQPGDPGLTVLINEQAHRRLGGMAAERGFLLLEQRDMAKMVAHDLRNAFTFFNEVYGPTTVESFVATEIPYSHGEAYTGLVMLAWNTFQWTTEAGFDEMFRAHEVAHQWWGIGVRPAT